ncbi:MAG TPA: hemolysin family protein [Streptosporangiaceae bacterium]
MLSTLSGLAAVVLLTAATGYFVAQEFAYTTADRAALEQATGDGDRRARRALAVMARLSFMLSGAQLGITVTALVVGFIAQPALAGVVEPALSAVGVPSLAVSVVVSFVVATVLQMVLGELVPKNLAIVRAEPLARMLAPSTLAYLTVAGPLIRLFDGAANKVLRAVGVEPVEELHHGATLEELSDIIGESRRSGHLPADLSGLLEHALTFGEHTAGEVMVPRPGVVTVDAGMTVDELLGVIRKTGHTSYPMLGPAVDEIVGVVGVRELVRETAGDRPVDGLARPALLVPDSLPLYALVERMHEGGEEFVCVVDEYGGLAGVVTFEDVAEELVGEIADENDPDPDLVTSDESGVIVDAGRRIDEINVLTGVGLPEDSAYDTVAGLIMARLSRMPRPGDTVIVDQDVDRLPAGKSPGRVAVQVLTLRRRVAGQVRLRTLGGKGGGPR